MKNLIKILSLILLIGVMSCSKKPTTLDIASKKPTTFNIAGQWGVYDVTFIYPDMEPTHLKFTNNFYCDYWTFQVNGILSVVRWKEEHINYGDYYYNANIRKLKYIYEGYSAYIDADVDEVSPTEMIITAHFNSAETTIYKMKKLAW